MAADVPMSPVSLARSPVGCRCWGGLFGVGVVLCHVVMYLRCVMFLLEGVQVMCELVIVKCWTCGAPVDALEGSRAYCSIDCTRYALGAGAGHVRVIDGVPTIFWDGE
jgi:endogenous inhibitor of DNA gyrase (YacG/DUF329 family)